MLNNPDLFILRATWKEYAAARPVDANDARKSLVAAWREYSWILEPAWRGMMQRVLPPVAWNFLSEAMERRVFLRQIWLREGGWLLTKRGTRRKKHFKGQRRPRVKRIRKEVDAAYQFYLSSVSAESLAEIDITLLAVSGVFYTECGGRKRAARRFRDTWDKLSHAKARMTGLPAGILQLPWRRRKLR